jgi:hypothetical protein
VLPLLRPDRVQTTAQTEDFDFVAKTRASGVEVLELHNLPAEMLGIPSRPRAGCQTASSPPNDVGLSLLEKTEPGLSLMAWSYDSSRIPDLRPGHH